MKYLLYRILRRMHKIEDEYPILRSFVYISAVLTCIAMAIFILLSSLFRFLSKRNIINFDIEVSPYISGVIFVMIVPALFSYFKYFYKKDMSVYYIKYEKSKLNDYFYDFYLFLIPILIFFGGIILSILLFGGTILEHKFQGILNQ